MIAGAGRFLVQERHRPVLASAVLRAKLLPVGHPQVPQSAQPNTEAWVVSGLKLLVRKPLPNRTRLTQIRA